MKFQAAVVDLDGTLLLPGGEVGSKTRQVLSRLNCRGIPVFVATGRPLAGALKALEGVDIEPVIAVYNGTQIVDVRDNRVLRQQHIARETVSRLIERLEEKSHDYFVYHDEVKYMRSLTHHEVCEDLADIFIHVHKTLNPDGIPRHDVPRVSLFGTNQDLTETKGWIDRFEDIYVESFPFQAVLGSYKDFSDSDLWYVEAQAACEGKKEMLNFIESEYGIPFENVIAFGDQANDLSLLKHAGRGVAVANAFDECLKIADEVIGPNADESVAAYLEELFL